MRTPASEQLPGPPSGAQHEISHGDQRATITEVGATLREYVDATGPVVDGFGRDQMCDGGRGQPLIPWPNRLAGGRYSFDGHDCQAALDEPERGNAIHGLVRWANWSASRGGTGRVAMSHTLHPQPGYPFTLELTVSYSLGEDGLTVETTALNAGEKRLPLGAGFHPYLTVGTDKVDDVLLELPARARLTLDDKGVPDGKQDVSGSPLDFNAPRRIGQIEMDVAYCDLTRGADDRVRVVLSGAGTGRSLTLWADERFPYLMCFTGDTLAEPGRRRRGLAVEPMTCPPNALQTGQDLVVLDPGESFSGAWGITPR